MQNPYRFVVCTVYFVSKIDPEEEYFAVLDLEQGG